MAAFVVQLENDLGITEVDELQLAGCLDCAPAGKNRMPNLETFMYLRRDDELPLTRHDEYEPPTGLREVVKLWSRAGCDRHVCPFREVSLIIERRRQAVWVEPSPGLHRSHRAIGSAA